MGFLDSLFGSKEITDPQKLFDLGRKSMQNGHLEKAEEFFLKAASIGHIESMKALALGYSEFANGKSLSGIMPSSAGFGVNILKEFEWNLKAAQMGDASAQWDVGQAYIIGEAVPQDYLQALHWFDRASKTGNIRALLSMADIYNNARSGARDADKAEALYLKVTEVIPGESGRLEDKMDVYGDAASALGHLYGGCYLFGFAEDSKSNPQKALYWFYQAYFCDKSGMENYLKTLQEKKNICLSNEAFELWKQEHFRRWGLQ